MIKIYMMRNYYNMVLPGVVGLMMMCGCKPKTEHPANGNDSEVKLITLDPGHFHAALVQKKSYPQVSNEVYVYAPEGNDLNEHLARIEAFNARPDDPTHWNEIVYTGEDFLERMLSERKGNVMITAGNNGKKTEYILKTLQAGINVLADKPMAIEPEQFELLKQCFATAEEKDVLLYDIMTERYEITTMLQRALSRCPEIFGQLQQGTPECPAVTKESVHHFFKTVSGNPLRRPAWYFDVTQQGEGIVDVTTHLVDLVQWECFPEQILNYQTDIEILAAKHWTTAVDQAQFRQVTGLESYPEFLKPSLVNDTLQVYANGEIDYKLKGVCVKISVVWDFEAPAGTGDTHFSVMRGTKADLFIRQGAEQNYIPELYLELPPGKPDASYLSDLETKFAEITKSYPGIALQQLSDNAWKIVIPETYRNGHEAHFGQVTEKYLDFLHARNMPEWEIPNMIAKYFTTTEALRVARGS